MEWVGLKHIGDRMYVYCTKCGPARSKSNTKTLSVRSYEDSYIIKCFHAGDCEWNVPVVISEEELDNLGITIEDVVEAIELPEGEPIPEDIIPKDNLTNVYYRYHNRDGNIMMLTHRLNTANGKKIFPMRMDNGVLEYGAVRGKFLYNMPLVQKYTRAQILVVEGEKTAEYAQTAFLKANMPIIVTTWPLGCSNVNKGDWDTIKGRDVTLWPDNDTAGIKAMEIVRSILENADQVG